MNKDKLIWNGKADGATGGGMAFNIVGDHENRPTDMTNIVVIALEGNGTRPTHKGKGYSKDGIMFTLNSTEVHAVAYDDICRKEIF